MSTKHTPGLLDELKAAHKIILNALQVMTTEQKIAWSLMNEKDGLVECGATRATEREAVIAKATGDQPCAD